MNSNGWRDDLYNAPEGKAIVAAEIDDKVIKHEAKLYRMGPVWLYEDGGNLYPQLDWTPTHWRND